jgi:hypothetical protein
MPDRKNVIPPNMVLTERAGIQWTVAPNYQDRDSRAPGWLALRSSLGDDRTFSQVVMDFGFLDRDEPYLVAVIKDVR